MKYKVKINLNAQEVEHQIMGLVDDLNTGKNKGYNLQDIAGWAKVEMCSLPLTYEGYAVTFDDDFLSIDCPPENMIMIVEIGSSSDTDLAQNEE